MFSLNIFIKLELNNTEQQLNTEVKSTVKNGSTVNNKIK